MVMQAVPWRCKSPERPLCSINSPIPHFRPRLVFPEKEGQQDKQGPAGVRITLAGGDWQLATAYAYDDRLKPGRTFRYRQGDGEFWFPLVL